MFDVIAFDADDTLWHNESIFTMTQQKFREMLSSHGPEVVDQTLSSTQLKNLKHFGYGIKGFILSMIETSKFDCLILKTPECLNLLKYEEGNLVGETLLFNKY